MSFFSSDEKQSRKDIGIAAAGNDRDFQGAVLDFFGSLFLAARGAGSPTLLRLSWNKTVAHRIHDREALISRILNGDIDDLLLVVRGAFLQFFTARSCWYCSFVVLGTGLGIVFWLYLAQPFA